MYAIDTEGINEEGVYKKQLLQLHCDACRGRPATSSSFLSSSRKSNQRGHAGPRRTNTALKKNKGGSKWFLNGITSHEKKADLTKDQEG
jgi:hypothetical protein